MVLQKFPVANLLGQLVRQITQPLSKTIMKHVKKRPFLRKYVLIQLGRFYYWCEDRITGRKMSAVAKRKLVDDIRTMELGTKLLLEVTKNSRDYETDILHTFYSKYTLYTLNINALS